MSPIIESVGHWGVRSTQDLGRFKRPRPGDWVQFPEELRKYPVGYEYCRITSVDECGDVPGKRITLVDGAGSCFLSEDGSLSVSGGPFFGMFVEHLDPLYELRRSEMWNWGDNSPGAEQGCHYHLDRPVFLALRTPGDFEQRIANTEEVARLGGMFGRSVIPQHAKLHCVFPGRPSRDNAKEFWFDTREENHEAQSEIA